MHDWFERHVWFEKSHPDPLLRLAPSEKGLKRQPLDASKEKDAKTKMTEMRVLTIPITISRMILDRFFND